jgi:hypothetical protein
MSPAAFTIEPCHANFGHVRARFEHNAVVNKGVRADETGKAAWRITLSLAAGRLTKESSCEYDKQSFGHRLNCASDTSKDGAHLMASWRLFKTEVCARMKSTGEVASEGIRRFF